LIHNFYPDTLHPLAIAIAGLSDAAPQFPETVIVFAPAPEAPTTANRVYKSFNAVGPNEQF
jgi:hypothetical protein